MKKLWIAIMICAICASFAACVGSRQEPATEATTQPTETTSAPYDWSEALNNSGSGCAMQDPIIE